MDALLVIDATQDYFPSELPQPLVDLVDRARGVGGVIVHVAAEALEDPTGTGSDGDVADGDVADGHVADEDRADVDSADVDSADEDLVDGSPEYVDGDEDEDEDDAPQLQIDSALGTRDDELVLVSAVPDVFDGIEDLAEGLDDLGVDRIIMVGSNARDALLQSAYAALAIGFELIVVVDGIAESGDWVGDLEASGAVTKNGADVWLKM